MGLTYQAFLMHCCAK